MVKSSKNQQAWLQAKKKYHLSEEVLAMAKQLGLNPKKFGGLANHQQERWKEPLAEFIRSLHEKRFGSN